MKFATVMFVSMLALQAAPALADDAKGMSADKQTVVESKKHKSHKAKLAMVGGEKASAKEGRADGYIPDAPSSEFISGGGGGG